LQSRILALAVGAAILAICCWVVLSSLVSAGDIESAGGNQCWGADSLSGKSSDKTIVKDTPKAIVAEPQEPLAAYSPSPRGAIRRVELPSGDKRIALTFDLCEQPYEVAGYDAEIVNILRETGAKATFFGGGKWMLTHKDKAQQLIADPLFEMGNHSWEHRNLRLLEGERLVNEIRWAQVAYERQVKALSARQCLARDGKLFAATKANNRMSLFRFPFGACNPAALDAVARLGLLPIQWDISSGDPTNTISGEAMAAAVARQARPGSIVLFHANGRGWNTAAALRLLIPKLRSMGYEFATVTELLNTPGAKVKREDICYDAKPGDVDRHDALARRLSDAYERFYARFKPRQPSEAQTPLSPPPPPVPAVRPAPPAETPDTGPRGPSLSPP
jgi:peptidoglycan/xylan/chitin deacetylase (PgdA/CDA1 family)